ncbi:MAG: hypothetical protein CM15mP98_08620 [Paracoccaceae bacterium]|nr:MAG: hypothetical protein CM15mP98_08620 [Paracoccaceae bacterium]
MQLSQSLNIKQKQSLVMTPQLQQAIKLLQLTNLELRQFLRNKLLTTLYKCRGKNQASDTKDTGAASQEKNNSNSEEVLAKEETNFSDDPTSNEDYENRFDNSNIDYGAIVALSLIIVKIGI